MKKLIVAVLVAVLTVANLGCGTKDEVRQEKSPKQQTASEQPRKTVAEEFQPNLSGIKLGDSKEKVIQSLGTDYKLTTFDEEYFLGEPFMKLSYNNGMTVVLGSNSNRVLEIESNSPTTSTNLGFNIGDKAQDVLTYYRSKYKEAISNQGDGKLIGWFLLNDHKELIIFDFDKDESWGNADNIKPNAKVERIRLTNFKYMD